MKLSDFASISKNINNLEEAGGFIDRKILSRVGTKRTKMTAQTKIIDKQRAEQLWDAWLEVTGGGDKFNVNELISWLIKEVKINGINIDKNLINAALSNSKFADVLNSPVSTNKSKNTATTAPKKPIAKTAQTPRKKSTAKKPTTTKQTTTKQTTTTSHPEEGGFISLDLPAMSAPDNNWYIWAEKLSKEQPTLYLKLAKSFGANIKTPNNKRSR